MFKRFKKFLTDVKAELKKVTWPTKEETIKQTGVVLVVVAFTGIFLFVIDTGLTSFVKMIIG